MSIECGTTTDSDCTSLHYKVRKFNLLNTSFVKHIALSDLAVTPVQEKEQKLYSIRDRSQRQRDESEKPDGESTISRQAFIVNISSTPPALSEQQQQRRGEEGHRPGTANERALNPSGTPSGTYLYRPGCGFDHVLQPSACGLGP